MVFQSTTKKEWFNWHNRLFGGIFFAVVVCFLSTLEYRFVNISLIFETDYLGYTPLDLTTVDYQIPVVGWMCLFYVSCFCVWTLGPLFIWFFCGPKRFCKFISIVTLMFLLQYLISICVNCNTHDLMKHYLDELGEPKNWFETIEKQLWSAEPIGNGAFPSNHCSNTLVICFSAIDFAYFTKDKSLPNRDNCKWWNILKHIIVVLFSFYTLMVVLSTFLLKMHYVVDWIPALFTVSISNLIFALKPECKYVIWWRKLMFNFRYMFRYCNESSEEYQYVTWAKRFKDHYLFNNVYAHYIFADIFCSLWLILNAIHTTINIVGGMATRDLIELLKSWSTLLIYIAVPLAFYFLVYIIWRSVITHNQKKLERERERERVNFNSNILSSPL